MAVRLNGCEVEAVTFDFWWTLFRDSVGSADDSIRDLRVEYVTTTLSSRGIRAHAQNIESAFDAVRSLFMERHKKAVFTPHSEVVRLLFDHMNIQLTKPEIRVIGDELSRIGSFASLELMPGAYELIYHLKTKGVKVGLISDTVLTKGRHLVPHLRRAGILHLFDYLVFSDEIGSLKPSKENFEAALKRLNASPDKAIHIGDFPWSDIEGAKATGMLAVQYVGAGGPEKDNVHERADLVIDNFEDLLKLLSG